LGLLLGVGMVIKVQRVTLQAECDR